ncbi:MAG: crossover junction endodeoxyribonuclease RuvC [Planctomycetaceae bacterium]|nr:crossover junction endodeoxyribonuclease RuvC [Planctomycetaceae bacterium]
MRILGIDPGLRVTGYGVVDCDSRSSTQMPRVVEGGVLRIPEDLPLPARLRRLHEEIREVLCELEPDLVAVESVFTHPDRASTGVRMAHARGVLLLAAAQQGVEVVEHAPAQVKKSLTGDGSADKARMQLAIAARCGLDAPPEPSDVADALAIALCAANRLDDPISGSRPS